MGCFFTPKPQTHNDNDKHATIKTLPGLVFAVDPGLVSADHAFLTAKAALLHRYPRAQVSRVANGVGVPNISFDEIRALRVPRVSEGRQEAVEQQYRQTVLPHHKKAVARHARLRRAGADPKRDPALKRHREAGEREWRRVIAGMDAEMVR